MSVIEAICFGILQGITEFLPISSSGHLVIAHHLFGTTGINDLAFDAVLHLATASAVLIYFYNDIIVLVNAVLRKLGRLPVNDRDIKMVYAIVVGTIPAVILGILLEDIMATAFRHPVLVAVTLVLGSILFIYAEWIHFNNHRDNQITMSKGLKIGLFQSLALVPGVSRSGASIAGGMILGLDRSEATRFSFLLAIPVMFGAGGKKVLELLSSTEAVSYVSLISGGIVAFMVGLFAIHFMLGFVRRYSLWPFIWYRIILAFFVLFFYYFG